MQIFTGEVESIFKVILKFQKLKTTMIEIKKLYRGFNTAEDVISEMEDRALENVQFEAQREKKNENKEYNRLYERLNNCPWKMSMSLSPVLAHMLPYIAKRSLQM